MVPVFGKAFDEAQTMANLDHPHLVPIFDFGETSSSDSASKTIGRDPVLVMEFVPKTLVTNAPVSNWRDLNDYSQTLSALSMPTRGAIHRDNKPTTF